MGDFSPTSCLALVPESSNRHDRHTVALFNASGRHQCGHVLDRQSRRASTLICTGRDIVGVSLGGGWRGEAGHPVSYLIAERVVVDVLLRGGTVPITAVVAEGDVRR